MHRLIGWTIWSLLAAMVFVPAAAEAQTNGQSKAEFWIETGVMKQVPADPQAEETFTAPRPIVEVMEDPAIPSWDPNYTPKSETAKEIAKQAIYRRTIWNLAFAFKPLRMIEVDLPQRNGKMQRKQLWYMVYRITNNGYHLGVKAEQDKWDHKTYLNTPVNQNIYFFPHFVLQAKSPVTDFASASKTTTYTTKEYLDRVIPAAMKPIAERERIGAELFDSVSITKHPIPVSDAKVDRSVWGVAIWEDVDPQADFFSVFVQGLTNAYKFEDVAGAYKAGDPPGTGRKITSKTLQLNFWRPGDAVLAHEDEIRFGIPLDPNPARQAGLFELYGVPGPLDYQWVYR
jgi:hypothetical protein